MKHTPAFATAAALFVPEFVPPIVSDRVLLPPVGTRAPRRKPPETLTFRGSERSSDSASHARGPWFETRRAMKLRDFLAPSGVSLEAWATRLEESNRRITSFSSGRRCPWP